MSIPRQLVLQSWPTCIYNYGGGRALRRAQLQPLTVEHVIPKFWFKELYGKSYIQPYVQAAVHDPLHLFPAGRLVNSQRGHKALHFFPVPDESKGVIARALVQMSVKYPEIHIILPEILVGELLEEWLTRPVCGAERRRAALLTAATQQELY
jgi:endonuclease I